MTYSKVIENRYSQVGTEVNQLHIYRGIVGHQKGRHAVDKANQFSEKNGRRYKKKTTVVWDM